MEHRITRAVLESSCVVKCLFKLLLLPFPRNTPEDTSFRALVLGLELRLCFEKQMFQEILETMLFRILALA
jgi:hypothetical protein